MKQNYLPPLLRGIGTTVVLLATIISVLAARSNVQKEHATRAALHAKAEAEAAAQPIESRKLAELKVEVDDLRNATEEETVAGEVMENPWFNMIGLLGTAIVASSFYVEAFSRKRERT